MNNRVNYSFVGFLVLIGIILMFGFTYWLLDSSPNSQQKKYTIYFDESVLGLNLDAPVKYRGIRVGKVSNLQINTQNSEQIEVTISILKTTPIKMDTVAKLTAQGITGLTYINLSNASRKSPPLEIRKGEKYPVIKTLPSFFENLESSFSSMSSKFSSTLGKTEELLGDDNQKQMALLLRRTASMMRRMEILLDNKTIVHLQNSAKNLDEFTTKINTTIPLVNKFVDKSIGWEDNVSHSLNSVMQSYKGIKSTMDVIKSAVSGGEFNIKDISAEVVPTINGAFLEMQELMVKFEDVLEQYNKSPSDIFYKTQEIKKAPGEK